MEGDPEGSREGRCCHGVERSEPATDQCWYQDSPACAARSTDGAQLGRCSARQPHQLLGKPGASRTGRSGVCGERHGTDPGSKPCWMGEGEDTERGSEGGSVARKARRALGTWLRGTLVGMAGRTTATKRPQADSVAEERSELRGQLTDGTQTLPCGHENAKRGTGGLSPRWLAEEGGLRAAGSKRKAGHGRSLVLSVDTALDDLRHGTPGMRGSGRCAGELTLMRWCDLTSS